MYILYDIFCTYIDMYIIINSALIQMILDYIIYSEQMEGVNAFKWQKYQCAVHIFSNSPNAVHAIASFFSFCTSFIIKRFDKTARLILFILIFAEVFLVLMTPVLASLFTHLVPGILTYAQGSMSLIIPGVLLFKWVYIYLFNIYMY